MRVVEIIVIWGLVAIASAGVAALIAGLRNRDHSAWAAWCFVLPPLLLILIFLRPNRGPKQRRPTLDEEDAREHA